MSRKSRVPAAQIISIFALLICFIAVLALRKGCSQGVANLFNQFEPLPDAGPLDGGSRGGR